MKYQILLGAAFLTISLSLCLLEFANRGSGRKTAATIYHAGKFSQHVEDPSDKAPKPGSGRRDA